MSAQTYAILDPSQTTIVAFETMDSASFAAFPAVKSKYHRPVNMTAQPGFNPATQFVFQNGWTVGGADVQPIWVIGTLTAAQQKDYANAQTCAATTALNIVAAGNNAIANWGTLTAGQKDTVLLDIVKTVVAMLEYQFGINN